MIGLRQPLIDHKREALERRRLLQDRFDEIAVHVRALLNIDELRRALPAVFDRRIIRACLANYFRPPGAPQPSELDSVRSSQTGQRSMCANLDLLFEVFPSHDPMRPKKITEDDKCDADTEWAEAQWSIVHRRFL
eukprot:TRINITY_DN10610_c0_g1_i1.p1 TRINITY_DN10610_c0_g1~~TRINITY_DN10610_c0_g1_i1.p1  ORF type:complete len:135 (+),score=19.11 TRINITY_DN10610_c0_g1_i1:159-563(+)